MGHGPTSPMWVFASIFSGNLVRDLDTNLWAGQRQPIYAITFLTGHSPLDHFPLSFSVLFYFLLSTFWFVWLPFSFFFFSFLFSFIFFISLLRSLFLFVIF